MPNWCENEVLVQGPEDEIKRYKDSLLRDSNGKYYPWFSTVPLPELKDESEVKAYVEKESNTGTVFMFHDRVISLEVIENSPGELELHFYTAYCPAQKLCTDELFPKLSILQKYFEPINYFHGFIHFVKGKAIAEGYEQGEDQLSPWQMYDYKPWPEGVDPLKEKLKKCIAIPCNKLRPVEELIEILKKEGAV